MSYHGIENPFGEVFEYEDGVVVDITSGGYWYTEDTSKYASTGYT